MSHLQLHTIQHFVETLLNQAVCEVKKLGVGATSSAWSITCGSDQYVLRVTYSITDRPITYRSEFLILRQLFDQGLPVPEPLYNSFEQFLPLDEHISAWALTRLITGRPILDQKLTPAIAEQLEAFISALHRLPCSNYGRLDENSEMLIGQQTSLLDGIRARWCWAQLWPFDGRLLSDHAITTIAPNLRDTLMAVERDLWNVVTVAKPVLTHSDLYGEHIFIIDDHTISGIIDFGAAFIATPAWDFAVLAHYYGWDAVKMILNSYTTLETQRYNLLDQSQYLAIVVGLYKLQKAVSAKSGASKQQRISRFISETLSVLQ